MKNPIEALADSFLPEVDELRRSAPETIEGLPSHQQFELRTLLYKIGCGLRETAKLGGRLYWLDNRPQHQPVEAALIEALESKGLTVEVLRAGILNGIRITWRKAPPESSKPEKAPTHHDPHTITDRIQRISVFNPPHAYSVHYASNAGCELWMRPPGTTTQHVVGGGYDKENGLSKNKEAKHGPLPTDS